MPSFASVQPKPPAHAPIEFAGQWVAWNRERTTIVAHGKYLASVHKQALAAGHDHAILQRVRRPDVSFIGVA